MTTPETITATITIETPTFTASLAGSATTAYVDQGDADTLAAAQASTGFFAASMIALPDDFLAGTFADVDLIGLDGGSLIGLIPRAGVTAGTVVLIPSASGDSSLVGLWTATASGPWTRNATQPTRGSLVSVGFAQLTASSARIVLASSAGGSAPTSYVTADDQSIDLNAYATTDALGTEQDDRTAADSALAAAAEAARLITQASTEIVTRSLTAIAPTRWAVCGTDGGAFSNRFVTAFTIPSPTSTLRVRTLSRLVYSDPFFDGATHDGSFAELVSESLDGFGDIDRYEAAKWARRNPSPWLRAYIEGTAAAGSMEWQRGIDDGSLGAAVGGVWTWDEWLVDFAAHTATHRVGADGCWDHLADDSTRWLTTSTYTNALITGGLHATASEDTWLGNGPGQTLIASVEVWCDDVLVLAPNIAGADIADTTLADLVSGDTWTAEGAAAIDGV